MVQTTEEKRQANARYYQEHKAEWYARNKAARRANPEGARRYMREYRQKNHKRLVEQRRSYRLKLMSIIGGLRCVKCGYDKDARALVVDHRNGGGTRDASKHGKGTNTTMYYYYLNHPTEAIVTLQVLCANCNAIKRYENNERCIGSWEKTQT